jgi:hypothetical protein
MFKGFGMLFLLSRLRDSFLLIVLLRNTAYVNDLQNIRNTVQ